MNSEPNFTQALTRLPHGPEFRFLDCLTELVPGISGRGDDTVRGDEAFLLGHFPNDPIMPGVLLVEAVAQLAGIVAQTDPKHQPMPGLKLAAIRNAKIFDSARPGETLRIFAEVKGRLGRLVQANGTVLVGERLAIQTELTLAGG